MDFYKDVIPIIDDTPEAMAYAMPQQIDGHTVGYGLVPRDYAIDPPEMFAPPSGMELIPESEWDARYDEQERLQSSLEHLYLSGPGGTPAFEHLDQNGFPDCHTADTDVLTDRGFVAWPDYNWSDPLGTVNPLTHALEYQLPFQKHVREYDGPVIYSDNRRVDFAVTPNHQMYVRKWDEAKRTLSDRYSFVRADELGWYAGMLHAPAGQLGTEIVEAEVPGDRRYDGDDFFAMLGLVISDGFAGGTEKTRNLVSFASFRDDIRANIAALAARLGFKEAPSRRGVWNRWSAGALAEWIRANCYTGGGLGAQNKRVPDIVKCASPRQIKIFLHYFDDRRRDGVFYYSSSKRLIDDLQELHLKIGLRSVVVPNHTPQREWNGKTFVASDGYRLIVSSGDRLCLDRKKHVGEDRYKGEVYCAAVPNHTLITRRNGTVLISSNCWCYSTAHAAMLDRLKQNLPIVRFNPTAMATMLGRTRGGWCGLSAKMGREMGFPEEGDGPGQWPKLTRRNHDTPELRANMAKYKITEDWVDLTRPVYSQNLTEAQSATCSFLNIPGPEDFSWWRHSVCRIRHVRIERGSWGKLILNSWRGWGRNGLGVLRGSRMRCDSALAIRATAA